ncbi:unnamed protein product [Clonostachys rosea]|uniref:Uncharacterized protein n=1 Tax=Bionectria ochroleuca TaxID=29856 RepID=A0ABY6V2V5_BIOOC|nr:unnamed protein product [Clonostachys rosea]
MLLRKSGTKMITGKALQIQKNGDDDRIEFIKEPVKRRAFPTATNSENQEPIPRTAVACHLAVLTKQGPLPVFQSLPDFLAFINCTLLSQQVRIFHDRAYQDWPLSRLVLEDLPTLSRLNAFDALIRNA